MKSNVLKQFVKLSKALHSERERLETRLKEINGILGTAGSLLGSGSGAPARKGGMSDAGRARIAAAQRRRWAKVRAAKGLPPKKSGPKTKRTMSPEARARIAAAQRARWAKVHAQA